MMTILILLIIAVLVGKMLWYQLLSGLFLIGVTCFAPNTFGYDENQKKYYEAGMTIGRICMNKGGITDEPDAFWEFDKETYGHENDDYKKFWMRGFHRGLKGKFE